MKHVLIMIVMSLCIAAQPELPAPGITPDSPFYFMDTMFDGFQPAKARADERAAEMVAMAKKGNEAALEKARKGYEKAMAKRQQEAQENAEQAEDVARQSSNHMVVLGELRERIPEQARAGIYRAMNKSAHEREQALESLKNKDSQKAESVAKATLEEVLANAPEAAKAGIQRALNAQDTMPPSVQSGGNTSGTAGPENNAPGPVTDPDEVNDTQDTSGRQAFGSDGAENFRMLVSDAPADIADFEYLKVELSKTRIFLGEEFEVRNLNYTVDLTQLVGAVSTEVLETELEPGVYNKVELYVDSVDARVGNDSGDVMVPSGKLQIVKEFEIVEGEVTTFVFDINVIRKGQSTEYNLLPVISESGVVGKDLDESEVEEVEEDECNTSEDCESGSFCEDGECEEIECNNSTDCEANEECLKYECEERTCETAEDCAEGF
ncbi:MAG: DUF4382 domain-containing protein, partial [Nanobdellota archaeon]